MNKNDHSRKGKIMQKRTTGHVAEAERVWGLEVLDPLEQWEWAQSLWQRLARPETRRPLLLVYSPAAERAARRGLTALARIGREAALAVHYFFPGRLPVLPALAPAAPSLLLIHHGSRFLNVEEWINCVTAAGAGRMVLTAPAGEEATIAGAAELERVAVPEEEPDYCARQAQQILEKYFGSNLPADPALQTVEPVLCEAGCAEVEVPLTLLARHAGLESAALLKKLHASRWREFIWWPETSAATGTVVLRGRWLSEKMTPAPPSDTFPHLRELVDKIDPQAPEERYFFLHLLMSWRSRGNAATVAQLLREHYVRFHEAAAASGALERQAWGLLHPQPLPPRLCL